MRLPDPERSCAVLIGTSTYHFSELADLPAVRNNVKGLAEVLTSPALGGLLADRCIVLSDPADVRAVYRTLRKSASSAKDTLLVYFAGHGLTTPVRNELYLCLSGTDPDELRVSALSFDLIREVIGESPATNRILILDCCFSGRATEEFMSSAEETILGQLDIEGTYILTSAPATSIALAPVGAAYTTFTGELLTLLRTGAPNGPDLLTFDTIYRWLLSAMTARGLPRPGRRGTGTVDQLGLTRNPAYLSSASRSDIEADHGVEFGQSAVRLLRSMGYLQGAVVGSTAWAIAGLFELFHPLLTGATFFTWSFCEVVAVVGLGLYFMPGVTSKLLIDSTGTTLREGRRTTRFRWNDLSSVEIRREPGSLSRASSLSLVVIPELGSALLADKRWQKQWTKQGFLRIFEVKWLRGSPSALRTALVHHSGGRYESETSTQS